MRFRFDRCLTVIVMFVVMALIFAGCGGGGGGGSTATNPGGTVPGTGQTISGKITANSAVLPGVTVTLSSGGSVIGTQVTDSNGRYAFTGVAKGSYSVTPSPTSVYNFNPGTQGPILVKDKNIINVNFIALDPSVATYRVSGTVTSTDGVIPNATVTLTGTNSQILGSTDASGAYEFLTVLNGTYTIAASIDGYAFDLANVTVNGGPQHVDISASPGFTVSGKITLDGSGFAGVTVTLYGTNVEIYQVNNLHGATVTVAAALRTVQTAPDGTYTFHDVSGGSYTIGAASSGYVFSPAIPASSFTLTDTTLYVFDITHGGNSLTPGGDIIYNSSPTTLTNKTATGFDFTAALTSGLSGSLQNNKVL